MLCDSECVSGGVSPSGVNALNTAAPGGNDGNAFSAPGVPAPGVAFGVLAFFLRLAIKLS